MDKIVLDVIASYNSTLSLRNTASKCNVSEQKTRRILLSNGIIPDNERTRKVMDMHTSGIPVSEIAVALGISVNAVLSHLPYIKGMYKSDNPSANALNIRKSRNGL